MRWGVEFNKNQSFISAITKIFNNINKTNITNQTFKKKISDAIDIDSFLSLQNGTLVQIFQNSSSPNKHKFHILRKLPIKITILKTKDSDKIILSNEEHPSFITEFKHLKSSLLYKKIAHINLNFFFFVAKAFHNFQTFLLNDDEYIDYTYLWDIICLPNKKLFKDGINLIIIDQTNNDSTNNVQLICPSNQYSRHFYHSHKKNIILIKNDTYFEPLILFTKTSTSKNVFPIFDDSSLFPTEIKNIIEQIKKKLYDKCNPFSLPSLPHLYLFKENNNLHTLIVQLSSQYNKKYKIISYIINYDAKCVGIQLEITDKDSIKHRGVLMCYPSYIILDSISVKFIDDPELWTSYKDTIEFLHFIKSQNTHILCKPLIKIEEDGYIVGILTETHQFIQINPPLQNNILDSLETLKSYNHNTIDQQIFENQNINNGFNKSNMHRNTNYKMIQYIQIEDQFYNLTRLLLRKSITSETRIKIYTILNTSKPNSVLDSDKIKILVPIIKKLLTSKIKFYEYSEHELTSLEKIFLCTNQKSDIYCDTVQRLMIPKINLVYNYDNSKHYFIRLADELIRFKIFRDLVLEPFKSNFLPDEQLLLNEDEFIILDSQLTYSYFENLIPVKERSFKLYTTNDTTIPTKTITYSNITSIQNSVNEEESVIIKPLGNNKLATVFPIGTHERVYSSKTSGAFQLVSDIYESFFTEKKSTDDIKNDLLYEYTNIYIPLGKSFINTLKKQGKVKFVTDYLNKESLKSLFFINDFYLSNIDIWILMKKYNIPSIMLSNLSNGNDENKKVAMPLVISKNEQYIYILNSMITKNKSNKFHLITKNGKLDTILFEMLDFSGGPNSIPFYVNESIETHVKKQGKMNIKQTGPLTIETYISNNT